MDGKDRFEISGKEAGSIPVRIVSGLKKDAIENNSIGSGKTKVYDAPNGVQLSGSSNTITRLKNDYYTNHFQYKDRNLNYLIPIFYVASDPDNGPVLGAFLSWTSYGFKKQPFKQNHTLGGLYSFGTDGSRLSYKGQFTRVFGKFDFVMDAHWKAANFTQNFFGVGNNSINNTEFDLNYNRVLTENIKIFPQIRRQWDAGSFSLGAFFEINEAQRTPNRFISTTEAGLPERVFGVQRHVGLNANYQYRNTDNPSLPTIGMAFDINVDSYIGVSDLAPNHSGLSSGLTFYSKMSNNGKIVMANKVAFATRFGNDYDFYHGTNLGGNNSLRGFRNERFNGKTAFYNMNDLRFTIGKVKNPILPFTLGLTGSFDHGRVWLPNDEVESDEWHISYGGSLWFNILDLATLNFGYHL
ncbi:MAG: BamA/TamA family outer membrane protein, partial [Bacteroidota bacterium]